MNEIKKIIQESGSKGVLELLRKEFGDFSLDTRDSECEQNMDVLVFHDGQVIYPWLIDHNIFGAFTATIFRSNHNLHECIIRNIREQRFRYSHTESEYLDCFKDDGVDFFGGAL